MERTLANISDLIARTGADIITLSPKSYLLHHASSEDLMLMLYLINPKYYMPVIGDYRYMIANAVLRTHWYSIRKYSIEIKW